MTCKCRAYIYARQIQTIRGLTATTLKSHHKQLFSSMIVLVCIWKKAFIWQQSLRQYKDLRRTNTMQAMAEFARNMLRELSKAKWKRNYVCKTKTRCKQRKLVKSSRKNNANIIKTNQQLGRLHREKKMWTHIQTSRKGRCVFRSSHLPMIITYASMHGNSRMSH